MSKHKVDMILYESIITTLFVSMIVLVNLVLATSFQSGYYSHQGLIVLSDVVLMILGIFRIRIFFNDAE